MTGLSSATPVLIMEDCNMNKCPEVPEEEFVGNYTCPSTTDGVAGVAVHKDTNLEKSTTATTTSTTTSTTTTTTTTTIPIIDPPGEGSGSTVIISFICLVFSMIL